VGQPVSAGYVGQKYLKFDEAKEQFAYNPARFDQNLPDAGDGNGHKCPQDLLDARAEKERLYGRSCAARKWWRSSRRLRRR
jgi:hypothetical protein